MLFQGPKSGGLNHPVAMGARSQAHVCDDTSDLRLQRIIFSPCVTCRHPQGHKDGGLINTDLEGIKMSRSVVAEIVKQVGGGAWMGALMDVQMEMQA